MGNKQSTVSFTITKTRIDETFKMRISAGEDESFVAKTSNSSSPIKFANINDVYEFFSSLYTTGGFIDIDDTVAISCPPLIPIRKYILNKEEVNNAFDMIIYSFSEWCAENKYIPNNSSKMFAIYREMDPHRQLDSIKVAKYHDCFATLYYVHNIKLAIRTDYRTIEDVDKHIREFSETAGSIGKKWIIWPSPQAFIQVDDKTLLRDMILQQWKKWLGKEDISSKILEKIEEEATNPE